MTEKFVPSPEVLEQGLYVAYAALSTMAVVPIYFGSFASLKKWKNPKEKKTKKKKSADSDSDSSDDEDDTTESMSLEDAYMFPIFGSMTLFGLYLVFRYIDKTYVNYLLTAYFGLLGVMATTQVGVYMANPVLKLVGIKVDKWHLVLTKKRKGSVMICISRSLDLFPWTSELQARVGRHSGLLLAWFPTLGI
ncbi:Minor histocompatibility antigen H13 [Lunasporangiospora selenospora]|uniref:Minor histocompatibility antigen H13 n=1 Tax=Lunasporangiospora selenospora TaxID=979761 RepID=A0A9P6FTH9_9FUNG|nr:Minor histocompatibility antigen H13 [Lunasporangiospora selenospora]